MGAMLAIDVGNTNIKSAIFEQDIIRRIFSLETKICLETGSFLDQLLSAVEKMPQNVVISSVRRDVTEVIVRDITARSLQEPFVVDPTSDMGITNLYRTNETLGVDRIVNAAAAYCLYGKQGNPVVVVDMGTATTIDYVSPQGEFLGGAIAPGLLSASKGLEINAPELPQVDFSSDVSAIGRTTDECIRSGVVLGHAAMIQGMVDLMSAQCHETGPIVVITGGLSEVVKNCFPIRYIFDKNLTLKGLYRIYRLNRHQTC